MNWCAEDGWMMGRRQQKMKNLPEKEQSKWRRWKRKNDGKRMRTVERGEDCG